MNPPKPSRRKMGAKKLEPIDWHEFANDAVLNGNMSTLYHRPASEDPTAYASPEALLEIEKRVGRPGQKSVVIDFDSAGAGSIIPTVGTEPTVGTIRRSGADAAIEPTVGIRPTVGADPELIPSSSSLIKPTVGPRHTVGRKPTVGAKPTVGMEPKPKAKPIRDVQDALTLAGQVLYRAMYGAPDGAKSKLCTKGYRQLAAETHLDKDTVRDLIGEFKDKGIVRETRTYDPDTRSAKTYEVLSYRAILQIWRDANLQFVTTGRQRPMFCDAAGVILASGPTVGTGPTVGSRIVASLDRPTVGLIAEALTGHAEVTLDERQQAADFIQALQQITGNPVDQEAADRLIKNCRAEAPDCTVEEIVEFAWSKAFLCRSGKIENPIGFLITQIPKHFQGEALLAYRDNKRKGLEAAAVLVTREEQRRQAAERELAEMEDRQQTRTQIAERHRVEQGIDLGGLLQDREADDVLKQWASRMLKLGHRYQPRYD